MSESRDGLPILLFPSPEAWSSWLDAHSGTAGGAWLKFAKKTAAIKSVAKTDAIDVALCHGWIDGRIGKYDLDCWLIRFTPRGPKSRWSEVNRRKATELIEQGRMKPAGHAEVERAKADGRWDAAYAPQSTIAVPDDLAAALADNEAARTFFETLDSANRYAILYRIHDAKKAETRARRIETFVAMLGRGETIHPVKTKAKKG